MDNAQAPHMPSSKNPMYWILLILGVVLLMLGLAASAGTFMSNHISGEKLPNFFDFIFHPLILYFVPCLFISRGLAHVHSRLRMPMGAIFGITFFAMALTFMGESMTAYNYFVQLDTRITQSLNNVENAYQKRFNTIKNLNTASRRYQTHERETLKEIVEARNMAVDAKASNEKVAGLDKFDSTVRSLVLNIEQYPNLKADQLVLELMKNITATEQDLLKEKTDYNNRVIDYNKSVRLMPYALLARMFNFQEKPLINNEKTPDIYNARNLLAED